jgi:REP element-mobilizing transposase RayT
VRHLTRKGNDKIMGKRNRAKFTEPSIFFVTTTLKNWQPLMSSPEILDSVQVFLFSLIKTNADALMGYVLMPSHIHLLIGCVEGGKQLSEFMRSLNLFQLKDFSQTEDLSG